MIGHIKTKIERFLKTCEVNENTKFLENSLRSHHFIFQHSDLIKNIYEEDVVLGQNGIDFPFDLTSFIFKAVLFDQGVFADNVLLHVSLQKLQSERKILLTQIFENKIIINFGVLSFDDALSAIDLVSEELPRDINIGSFKKRISSEEESLLINSGLSILTLTALHVLKILVILQCENVYIEDQKDKVSRSSGNKRIKERYKVLRIKPEQKIVKKTKAEIAEEKKKIQAHHRRGHTRRIFDEEGNIKKRVFVSPCIVGGESLLEKDYIL